MLSAKSTPETPDLFADFNGLPDKEAVTEFYRHDADWSNRMILGDSLAVMASLAARAGQGAKLEEIAVLVRSPTELPRARSAVAAGGATSSELTEAMDVVPGRVAIGPMHLAKGLESRAVAVMACDDEVLTLQERIETVADPAARA